MQKTARLGSIVLVCAALLAAILGGCATTERNFVELLPKDLPDIAKGQPVAWQSALRAQEVDVLEFLGPDRLLLGTIAQGDLWMPEYRDLCLLDAGSQAPQWCIPRRGEPGKVRYQLLRYLPVIVIREESKVEQIFRAYDPDTGSELWNRSIEDQGIVFAFSENGYIPVIAGTMDNALRVTAIDPRRGNDFWQKQPERFSLVKDAPLSIIGVHDSIIVISGDIVRLSVADGSQLWKKPFPGTYGSGDFVAVDGKNLAVADGASLSLLSWEDGERLWQHALKGRSISLVLAREEGIIVVSREDKVPAREAVTLLDRTTGKALWTAATTERLQSPVITEGGALFFTTATKLMAIDRKNGAVLFVGTIPKPMVPFCSLPDHLTVDDRRIVVGRETGVVAYARDTGTLLFSESFNGGRPFLNEYLEDQYLAKAVIPREGRTEFFAGAEQHADRLRWDLLRGAQRLSDLQHRRRSESPVVSGGPRFYAAGTPVFPFTQLFYGAIAGSAEAFSAAYDDLARRLNPLIVTVKTDAHVRTARLRYEQSFATHAASAQGSFFIRPFYRSGWWLGVVDIRDGRRTDVLLSPAFDPLRIEGANLPAFAVDPSGARLIVRGTGLDPARYVLYDKAARSADWVADYAGPVWKMPYPSLLAYDLSKLRFPAKQGAATLEKTRTPAHEKNRELIRGAFTGNLETVEHSLEDGASVNAVDEYGYTALLRAAQQDNGEIMKFLLEKNADATVTDDYGWTPWHYADLIAGDLNMTALLVNAHSEQTRKRIEQEKKAAKAAEKK